MQPASSVSVLSLSLLFLLLVVSPSTGVADDSTAASEKRKASLSAEENALQSVIASMIAVEEKHHEEGPSLSLGHDLMDDEVVVVDQDEDDSTDDATPSSGHEGDDKEPEAEKKKTTTVDVFLVTDSKSGAKRWEHSALGMEWLLAKRPWEVVSNPATCTVNHKMDQLGWDGIVVTTTGTTDATPKEQAYAAGYAEGLATYERIWQSYYNSMLHNGMPKVEGAVLTYVEDMMSYIQTEVAANAPHQYQQEQQEQQQQQHAATTGSHSSSTTPECENATPNSEMKKGKGQTTTPTSTPSAPPTAEQNALYWSRVGYIMTQLNGIAAGYNLMAATAGLKQLTETDFFALNFQTELWEVSEKVLNTTEPPDGVFATAMMDGVAAESTTMPSDVKGRKRAPVLPPALRRRHRYFAQMHCSAIVKVTPQDVFVAHTTWGSVTTMVRQIKEYRFKSFVGVNVKFSSYPGFLYSDDDWYVLSSGLVVQETTNENYNTTLNDQISTNTVAEWIRTMVANNLAVDGATWATNYSRQNSGTYNDQWMVVDMNKFTPATSLGGQPTLGKGFFTVLEQMPKLMHWEDMTWAISGTAVEGNATAAPPVLDTPSASDATVKSTSSSSTVAQQPQSPTQTTQQVLNYWPSYNIPYFQDIRDISMNTWMAAEYGDNWNYTTTSRALMFKRDAPWTNTLEGIKSLIRENNCPHDPLCYCDTCYPGKYSYGMAIAARCDLAPSPSLDENDYCSMDLDAIDAKITSYKIMSGGTSTTTAGLGKSQKGTTQSQQRWVLDGVVQAGPSHESLPPFQWSTYAYRNNFTTIGMPNSFDFPWTTVDHVLGHN